MTDEVDTATDQPDPKAIVGGAFSAAAETYDPPAAAEVTASLAKLGQ